MSDTPLATLPDTKRMEDLSLAYIRAVVAQAGFVVDPITSDWDSRDGTIHATGGKRPKIDFQAKCHATVPLPDGEASFPFDLPVKNYEELRNPDLIFPHLLFVILVPRDAAERVSVTGQALILRHCGYWLSLRGLPETTNSQTCRVHVPRANVLDVSGLTGLMMRLNHGVNRRPARPHPPWHENGCAA